MSDEGSVWCELVTRIFIVYEAVLVQLSLGALNL